MEFNQPLLRAPSIPKLSKKNISSSVLRGTSAASSPISGSKQAIKLKSSTFKFRSRRIKVEGLQPVQNERRIQAEGIQPVQNDQSVVNAYIPSIASSLRQTNEILVEIQKQLSLDFKNRITQESEILKSAKKQKEASRRGREEKSLETVGKIGKNITSAFTKVAKPVKGIFSKIAEFFQLVLTGIVVNAAFDWLKNEENRKKIGRIFTFLAENWKIFAGILVGGLALRVLYKVVRVVRGIGRLLQFLRILPRNRIGGTLTGAGAQSGAQRGGGLFRNVAGQRRGNVDVTRTVETRTLSRRSRLGGTIKYDRQFDVIRRQKGIINKALQGVEVNAKIMGRRILRSIGMGFGQKSILKSFLKFARPILKRIPIIGVLMDFALSVALGEDPGRAAFGAIGAGLLAAIGTFIGGPIGTFLGGIAGDFAGRKLYDVFFRGKKKDPALEQMSKEGDPKKYKDGGVIPFMKGGDTPASYLSGMLKGPSHAQGGVPVIAEGNEYVVNKIDSSKFRPVLDNINYDGGRSWSDFSDGVGIQEKLFKEQFAVNDEFATALQDFRDMFVESAQKQKRYLSGTSESDQRKQPFLGSVISLFGAGYSDTGSGGGDGKGRDMRQSITPKPVSRNIGKNEGKKGLIELPPIVMNSGPDDIELPTFTDRNEKIPTISSHDSSNEYLNVALNYYQVQGFRFGD